MHIVPSEGSEILFWNDSIKRVMASLFNFLIKKADGASRIVRLIDFAVVRNEADFPAKRNALRSIFFGSG